MFPNDNHVMHRSENGNEPSLSDWSPKLEASSRKFGNAIGIRNRKHRPRKLVAHKSLQRDEEILVITLEQHTCLEDYTGLQVSTLV